MRLTKPSVLRQVLKMWFKYNKNLMSSKTLTIIREQNNNTINLFIFLKIITNMEKLSK